MKTYNRKCEDIRMEIKILEELEIREIYENYMVQDFPESELKPLDRILQMRNLKSYECLGFYEDDVLRAYGYLLKQQKFVLLDYFAVCSEVRGTGYGSASLNRMKEFYQESAAIILECESICSAKTKEEYQVRSKRIQFYKKSGYQISNVKAKLFDVEFSILYLPLMEKTPNIEVELEALYRVMLNPERYKKHVLIWKRRNQLEEVLGWDFEEKMMLEKKSLCESLHVAEPYPKVISLVGGGGKTTTMYQLADELAEQGLRVIVTTSTHIEKPNCGQVLEINHWEELDTIAWNGLAITIGRVDENCKFKLTKPDGDLPVQLADVILIEADGAKKKPMKVPADQEPVLVPETEMVIACVGLSAIGTSWEESCFRFHSDGSWLKTSSDDLITAEDIGLWFMDQRGGRKYVASYPEHEYRVLLNQGDTQEQKSAAMKISRLLPDFLRYGCTMTRYEIEGGNVNESN